MNRRRRRRRLFSAAWSPAGSLKGRLPQGQEGKGTLLMPRGAAKTNCLLPAPQLHATLPSAVRGHDHKKRGGGDGGAARWRRGSPLHMFRDAGQAQGASPTRRRRREGGMAVPLHSHPPVGDRKSASSSSAAAAAAANILRVFSPQGTDPVGDGRKGRLSQTQGGT